VFRKLLIGLAALVALAVAATLVAPYFVGSRAEAAFRANLAAFNAREGALQLHVKSYHRGFYTSRATLSVDATGGGKSSELVGLLFGSTGTGEIHVRINQGPIAIGGFGSHFSLMPMLYSATVHASDLPAQSVLGALGPTFYDEAWLTGGDRLTIDVPPGRLGLGVLGARWKGGHVVIATDAARDRIDYRGRIETLHVATLDPETGRHINAVLRPVSFAGHRRRAGHGLWVGADHTQAEGLAVSSAGAAAADVKGLREHSESAESADGRWYGAKLHIAQRGGTLHGWQWSHLDVKAHVDKVDAAGAARAVKQLRGMRRGQLGMPGELQAIGLLESLLDEAATPKTRAGLDAKLQSPQGEADVEGRLDFAATPASGAGTAAAAAAHATVRVTFPPAMVTAYAATVMGPGAESRAERLLAGLRQQGYLGTASDGRATSTIEWSPAGVSVNGRPAGPETAAAPAAATGAGL